jgi:hypothetical protein
MFTDPRLQQQFDTMCEANENSGRELIVASSWFLGEDESERMWEEYVRVSTSDSTTTSTVEGLAIKTTPRRLLENIYMLGDNNMCQAGKVRYVDIKTYKMTKYEASQAFERAFLKDESLFSHEQEFRIATMSIKRMGCVRSDGIPYKPNEVNGASMNNFENPGLYVGVKVDSLFTDIVMAPNAPGWLCDLTKRLLGLCHVNANIYRSKFDKVD